MTKFIKRQKNYFRCDSGGIVFVSVLIQCAGSSEICEYYGRTGCREGKSRYFFQIHQAGALRQSAGLFRREKRQKRRPLVSSQAVGQ